VTSASRIAGVAVVACLSVLASQASAQDVPTFRPKRLSVAIGATLTGSYPLGDLTATLRRNAIGAPPPYTLLKAESELERATGLDARVTFAATRTLAFEVGATYATPQLGVTVSEDAEAPGEFRISESVEQYTVEGSVVYHLPVDIGRRLRSYAIGGGGYLRQLHEGRFLVETGSTLHIGGGLQYWLRGGSDNRRPLGARADVRYVRRSGGIDFADTSRSYPAFSVLFFAGL
jgi:hypothetical protein